MDLMDRLMLVVVKLLVRLWEILFGWVYNVVQDPGMVRAKYNKVRARPTRPIMASDTSATWSPLDLGSPGFVKDWREAKCETMSQAWSWAVNRNEGRKLFGVREVRGEEDEVQHNGKVFKKLDLGDYRWTSYREADQMAENFGLGLRSLGVRQGDKVCMYADTRMEWMLAAQGCFKQGFPVVTIYTNLGEAAVRHGLTETEVETVITTHELLPKFRELLNNRVQVKTIVYMENTAQKTDIRGFREGVRLVSYNQVVEEGRRSDNNNLAEQTVPPNRDTPAIIMYTSGSTGVPKGVVLTHSNLVSTLSSQLLEMEAIDVREDELYIAYLPLAHVLELIGETMMVMASIAIGYSSPHTLTDKSSMVKRGGRGDCTLLRPTIMFCVPLILDRIYKGVTENIKKKPQLVQTLINFCIQYKLGCLNRGEITPIMDWLVFRSIRSLLGGKVRAVMSGGAPLAPGTHDYLKVVLCCPILQGYGLTETSACATIMRMDENVTGRVGPPVQGVMIQLVNWDEGNYRVTDKPFPRGEVVVGGGNVSVGYYNLPGKTEEDFSMDGQGRRWFRTGDIGQFESDGTLKIIDRRKDLVKLQLGEYVSLGKAESVLKGCPVVNFICVVGDSNKSYVVALVSPVQETLIEMAEKLGKVDQSFQQICQDKDVTGAVLREIVQQGKSGGLEKFEIPGAVTLCRDDWTPQSGLTTAAMKLKRRPLEQFYKADIERMFSSTSRT